MKKSLANLFKIFSIFSITIFIIVCLNYITDNLIFEYFQENTEAAEIDGIKKVDVEYKGNKIYLHIYTTRSLTCDVIIDRLDLKPFPVKNKIYKPLCIVVDKDLTKIIFEESITV